jgi:DNA-binding CsgD family transcriptional regulator
MRDPIGICESAYSLEGDERRWITQLGEAVRRNAPDDTWLVANTYDGRRPEVVNREMACLGVDERLVWANIYELYAPLLRYERRPPVFQTRFVGTLRQAPSVLRDAGVEEASVREFESHVDQFLQKRGMVDELFVNAQDPTGFGCCFSIPLRCRGPLRPQETHRWACVAAHVAAAFRVRRQLAALGRTGDGALPAPEAILRPDGALEHAEQPAQSEPARAALRHAVQAVDRARGALRRENPEQAVALWQGLVAGRWSLLDHFDSDGRRFVVAHRNDPRAPDTRGLTQREHQVVAYAALGHSNKLIAYELGLAVSTVSAHLARARAKLKAGLGGAVRMADSLREEQ